jgi:serine/threonine protein phosphatase 1
LKLEKSGKQSAVDSQPGAFFSGSRGRRYVIADIHACVRTFDALLDQIDLKKPDQLFLLGDYIDRGPSGKKVIDKLLQLREEGFKVFAIRGNHEEEILNLNKEKSGHFVKTIYEQGSLYGLFESGWKLKPKYLEFFQSMPYYIELDNFFLVHAGFNFNINRPFEDTVSMITIRNWIYDPVIAKGKIIIYGHTPTRLEDIRYLISAKEKTIPLDNGCVFNSFRDMGNLLCLRLEDFQLYIQPNID